MFQSSMTGRLMMVLAAALAVVGVAHAQMVLCPGGPCTGIDPGKRPKPPQYVSPPDMVLQFSTCPVQGSAAAAFVDGLRSQLASAMTSLDSNHDDPPPMPDVRQACVNNSLRFGAWLYPVGSYGSTDTATARNVGLSQMNVLGAGETFAFHFRAAGISRLVNIRWQDQPRRLDDDGNADPGGDVHLTGYHLDYTSSDYYERTVVDLGLDGWYDGLFSNTDITIHIYDFIKVNSFGGLNCDTYAEANPTETTVDTILASLTGGAGGSLGDIIDAGPGCKIAQMLPRSLLIPGYSLKAVFTYTRSSAYVSTGLTLAGTWQLLPRTRGVSISGPVSLQVEEGEPIVGHYDAYPTDLRYPLTFSWTSANATASGSDPVTMIWNIPGLDVGESVHRSLSLVVTDADGYQASAFRQINISRILVHPIPPMCQAKPWLPQCADY